MRLHVTKDKVKKQYTAAANPPGINHLWVSQDFLSSVPFMITVIHGMLCWIQLELMKYFLN